MTVYTTRKPYPLRGKVDFLRPRKKGHQKQKSWWRTIKRVASVERKIHSVEHSRQADLWLRLPSAKTLRKKLKGYTPIALKKVQSITGDYYQGRWKDSLLEIQWRAGLWQVCLRSPLTMRVKMDRVGKRRNATLENLIGRELQFVKSTSELLVFHVLHHGKMPVQAPPAPRYGKVTTMSRDVPIKSETPHPDNNTEPARVGHKIQVRGTQIFFTRK